MRACKQTNIHRCLHTFTHTLVDVWVCALCIETYNIVGTYAHIFVHIVNNKQATLSCTWKVSTPPWRPQREWSPIFVEDKTPISGSSYWKPAATKTITIMSLQLIGDLVCLMMRRFKTIHPREITQFPGTILLNGGNSRDIFILPL